MSFVKKIHVPVDRSKDRLWIVGGGIAGMAASTFAIRNARVLMTGMGTLALVLSLLASAAPAQTAQQSKAREQPCRDLVGQEEPETEGRSHVRHFQVQRFSDCMMGAPR
jgi:hypothetical protein